MPMNRVLIPSCLVVLTIAPDVLADPATLDYQANDPSCVDAARFADEVSAKLGFVPWETNGATQIRVRITREGDRFDGTFQGPGGASKVISGSTCAEVSANLAVTVAAAVDRAPSPTLRQSTAPLEHAPLPDDGKLPVSFRTTDGRQVEVSVKTGSTMASSSNGVRLTASYFEKLCTAPCTSRLPKGLHFLAFSEANSKTAGGSDFLINTPTDVTVVHHSQKNLRRGLIVAGAVLMAAGFWAAYDHYTNLPEGGVLGAIGPPVLGGLGIGLMITPIWIHDTFTATATASF